MLEAVVFHVFSMADTEYPHALERQSVHAHGALALETHFDQAVESKTIDYSRKFPPSQHILL